MMKKEEIVMKKLLICVISLLLISAIPIAIGETLDTNEDYEKNQAGTDQYSNCFIWIFGKCNTVEGPLVWKLGFFCPLKPRDFLIQASGQDNESLYVIVLDAPSGAYFSIENIMIDVDNAKGIFFWGGKSPFLNSNIIFVICKAENAWITK